MPGCPAFVHSALDAEKSVRILREAERALAFSAYLRRGKVQVTPAKAGPFTQSTTVIFDTREHYLEAVDAWEKEGKIQAEDARRFRELHSATDGKSRMLYAPDIDAMLESALLARFTPLQEDVQTALTAGHLNWVSMSFLGAPLPTFEFAESTGGVFHRGGTNVAESTVPAGRLVR